MIRKKRILAFAMALVLLSGTVTYAGAASNETSTGARLTYDGVKYKTARQAKKNDVFSDTRKGLLLQSYGSGSTADFIETFKGDFEIELKALATETRPNVSEFRLHFTSATTGETFSVGVKDIGSETSAYVIVDEDVTGVSYYVDGDDKSHGFTTSENEAGNYTKVTGAHTTDIVFEPDTMEIKIKNQGGKEKYKTIWCLTEEVLDGKRFSHTLEPFDYYNVSIEFTQVAAGQKGEILLYNVNGEDYGASSLTPVYAMINSNLSVKAVAGKEYILPEAEVYGIEKQPEIFCNVQDVNGKELVSGKVQDGVSFVPQTEGTYYLYYYAEGHEETGTYVTLPACRESGITCSISPCDALKESVGVNTTLSIPAREIESSLLIDGRQLYTDIIIAKDGITVEEKTSVQKKFDYTFEKAGVYTITWKKKLNGKEYTDSVTVNVDESIPGIVMKSVASVYDKNTVFKVPKATVYLDGKKLETKANVIKPSGETTGKKKVTLDEIGTYQVVYTYDAKEGTQSFTKEFSVKYGSENLFEPGEDTKVYYDNTSGNADLSGVQIEMSSKNAKATYSKTLDLSDNTKLDKLIELYVIPNTLGTRDMTGFYITLTDKLDSENQVSIRVIAGEGNMSSGAFVRVKATGQDAYLGLYKNHSWDKEPYTWTDTIEQASAHNKGGYTTNLDFAFESTGIDIQEKTLVLRYDAQEKAIYGQQRAKLVHDDAYSEEKITDLDDTTLYKNAWKGFTDESQVELSITPVSVSGTAVFKILSVDGQDLSSANIVDTTAPDVSVDLLGMDEAPVGKVGMSYPIFDVIATDDLCADDMLTKKATVMHNGAEVKTENDAFVPTEPGNYQIRYTVSDSFGNTTEKNVDVTVAETVPELKIETDGVFAETITYGMKYRVPDFDGVGGSGKHTLRTYYILDGKETEFKNSFVPMSEGEYTIVCEAKDYIGQTASISKTLKVEFEPEILFEDDSIVLPEVLAADRTYGFDKYVAKYYTKVGKDAKKVSCTIEVTDADGTRKLDKDRLYIPKMSDSVQTAKIVFTFSAEAAGKTIKKEVMREVKLQAVSDGNQFITDYFIKSNATMNALNRYTVFSSAGNGNAKISYIRPLQVRDFSLVMKAEQDVAGSFKSNFDVLRITLTDKTNKESKVQFDITKSGNNLMISVNGEKGVRILGSLTSESVTNIELGYKNEDYTVTGAENSAVGTVNTYLNGKTFKGFGSGEVYMEMELLGAKAGSAIDVISLNNQTLLAAAQDTIDPELFVDGSYSGIYTEGTKLTIPTASAYDVLNYTSVPKLSIVDESGKAVKTKDGKELLNVSADKEYTIQLEKLGRYTVTYTAEDASGRKTTASKTIEIIDDILPTLKLKGKYPETVKVGKTLKVKKYKLQDNGDLDKIEVSVYCSAPDGTMSEIKDGKIKTEKKGIYTVSYFLTDENGNKNVETFMFQAK